MLLNKRVRTFESLVLTPEDKHFRRNLKSAERYGKSFLVDTGFNQYKTDTLYSFLYAVVFDHDGDRRVVSSKVIKSVTIGLEV